MRVKYKEIKYNNTSLHNPSASAAILCWIFEIVDVKYEIENEILEFG
jgi:hypothetical protein